MPTQSLAGIMLDTKNLSCARVCDIREAAVYLRKIGADTIQVKRAVFHVTISMYPVGADRGARRTVPEQRHFLMVKLQDKTSVCWHIPVGGR